MMALRVYFFLFFILFSSVVVPSSDTAIVAGIIKSALETYHYRQIKIDDDLSAKAFDEFLKRIDFGKQFLMESDIEKLKKYKVQIDDELSNGNMELVQLAKTLVETRVKQVERMREKIMAKPFDFDVKESIETEPKKRDFAKNEKELQELWRKQLKYAMIYKILSIEDEQSEDGEKKLEIISSKDVEEHRLNDPQKLVNPEQLKNSEVKDKKGKKEKPEKLLSPSEIVDSARAEISKKYKRIFTRLLKETEEDYLEKLFNSVATIFDPHTAYMPPQKKEDFNIEMSGSLEGIGAVLQEDDSFIKVVNIVPGGAAWRQKELEVGDLIVMVAQSEEGTEPVDLEDMRVEDAVRHIRGQKGTEVRLTVKKVDGSRKVIKIVRDVVQIAESFAKSSVIKHKKLGKKVGYIKLPKFYRDFGDISRNCTDDVKKELIRLEKLGAEGIILDLRENGGGALEDARQMSGLFIDKGPIVQVKGYKGDVDILADTDSEIVYGGNLIIMLDRFSASASEILAGALQDYGRAVIIGAKHTHGKGTVQAVVNLSQGQLLRFLTTEIGALKVTLQKFYRVTGSSTQHKGITPDIILPDRSEHYKSREQDLDFALQWDEINPVPFEKWPKAQYNVESLISKSASRMKNNVKFKRLKEAIDYLVKRNDETSFSLNIADIRARDNESKELNKKLKTDEFNKDIVVSEFEKSIMSFDKITVYEKDKKRWAQDIKEKKKEWIEKLQKDIELEEALYVMQDMIKSKK